MANNKCDYEYDNSTINDYFYPYNLETLSLCTSFNPDSLLNQCSSSSLFYQALEKYTEPYTEYFSLSRDGIGNYFYRFSILYAILLDSNFEDDSYENISISGK